MIPIDYHVAYNLIHNHLSSQAPMHSTLNVHKKLIYISRKISHLTNMKKIKDKEITLKCTTIYETTTSYNRTSYMPNSH